MVIWLTGLTASGKTTLGKMLEEKLVDIGCKELVLLDGDILRKRGKFLEGHSLKIRLTNFELLINLVINELDKHKIVIVSTVSHLEYMRTQAREKLTNFYEIFLNCNPYVCEKRDYKNLYKKARRISLTNEEIFPGITEPYQKSKQPDLILNTDKESVEESFDKLYQFCFKIIETNLGKF